MSDAPGPPTATPAEIPAPLWDALDALGEGDWRTRKAAAESLRALIEREYGGDPPFAIVDALLERVLDPEVLAARAPALEVLDALGPAAREPLRARIDASPRRVLALVELLGRIGTSADVARLRAIAFSEEDDENLRCAAVEGMAMLGGQDAVPPLVDLLDLLAGVDGGQMLLSYTLDALRRVDAKLPVERISPLLEIAVLRRATVALLGDSGDPAAIPHLLGRIGDRMAGVRAEVVRALAALRRELDPSGDAKLVDEAVRGLPGEAGEIFVELVGHGEQGVRTAAIEMCAIVQDASALAAVVGAMGSAETDAAALAYVASLGAAANASLLEQLEHGPPEELVSVLRLIGALRPELIDARVLPPVMGALEAASEELAIAACEALAAVGNRAALAPLYRACEREGLLGEHAADALSAIILRAGDQGREALHFLIGGKWPQVGPLARNLCRVVARLGREEFVPPLVSLLGSEDVSVRVGAASALGQFPGEHEGLGALCFALADEDLQVRAAACRSLGLLRSPRAVQPLLSASSDPLPVVRAAAVQALVAIGNAVALPRLRELIQDDDSPNVVVHAIAGLGQGGGERDLALLMSLCTSSDREVIKAAARALASFRAHRATAALLGLLRDSRWDVRWTAGEVLAARGDLSAVEPLRRYLEAERDELVRGVLERALRSAELASGVSSAGLRPSPGASPASSRGADG